jgi:hypothetical protein
MKKLLAISFLFMYMFSATEVKQLLKIPLIFQHFKEHSSENKAISFLQFMGMHYLHGSPLDKDYSRDMQLPFKTSNDYISCITSGFLPFAVQFSIDRQTRIPEMEKFMNEVHFISSSYLANIWQPPKSC